ncbi:23S rRNA (adenine(1618)-N(6))-methyltransferase RlmF [Vibrio ostreicida]|uniref:23S rRNA (adenine(1618)-N(6))-methyltransferase RlmF n=1 Tax=Vibrio ostreicida TaxID=526588 RepID=UPI003B5B3550
MTKQPNKASITKNPSDLKFTTVKGQAGLHKLSRHHGRYDFSSMVSLTPELKQHIVTNPHGESSINFSDPIAVKLLNKSLLAIGYGVTYWDIPSGYLCPPVPGRADYIHRLAELLGKDQPRLEHNQVRALDIGVGANCIYPIVGVRQYGWYYIGSDIDPVSIENANQIVSRNPVLAGRIDCRLQPRRDAFFTNIIRSGERYDVTTCNPPFHQSFEDAQQGTTRKLNNLSRNRHQRGQKSQKMETKASPILNFGGQHSELWCPGGEAEFVKNLVKESQDFSDQVLWFSTLISKKDNVRWMRKNLERVGAKEAQVVEMKQGQKVSRFVAWTFQTRSERQNWRR